MYVEWEGDPTHLRLVEGIQLEEATIRVESSGVVCKLFEGTVKDAQAVFNAIRKRLGVTLITTAWMQKTAAKRWKGND